MTECILEARSLAKSYDNGQIQALRGVDLEINAGEFVAIVGPSGSGKSTLLQLFGGLDQPSSGEVRFHGETMSDGFDLDRYRSQSVGFVFQAFHLLPALTATENVQVPMFEAAGSSRERRERSEHLLTRLGLGHRLRQYPNQLSAGERQRVALARSLANSPEVLLADEPTGNLDSENSSEVMKLLAELQAERKMTLILVTHAAEIAASAQRVVHIRDGRLTAS